MATTESAAELDGEPPHAPHHAHHDAQDSTKPAKRSWRRKYRKMRAHFEDTMHASNTLIRDEFKAVAVARRLQEQNDQILEALLDMNEDARLPPSMTFDLRDPEDIDAEHQQQQLDQDPDTLQRRLADLRADLASHRITPEAYAVEADRLFQAPAVPLHRSLLALDAAIPHSVEPPEPPPEGLLLRDHAPGYMSPSHEEEYLAAIDAALAEPGVYDPDAHDGRPLRIASTRPVPSEKELSIQNPDSVYNWLRKHQPQVFLQDKDAQAHQENASEKSARPSGASHKKRASAAPVAPPAGPGIKNEGQDEEMGAVPEAAALAKGRRGPRDDDHSYRPKGGSSRPSKRKREDGDSGSKSSRKKGRASGGGAAAGAGASTST